LIPLHDENPTIHRPIVTIVLIALNVLIFLWQDRGSERATYERTFSYGAVPYNVTQDGEVGLRFEHGRDIYAPVKVRIEPVETMGRQPGDITQPLSPGLTLLTSMFLHGGWMHLLFNMWFLWIFGNNCEDAMGRGRFTVFYLLTGLIATGVHIASETDSVIPTIGASGAISGILGAYVLLFPRARVLSLVPLGYILTTIRLPAVVFLGIWLVTQILNVFGTAGGGVAWFAHIGGFLGGLALVKLFESKEHRERGDLGRRMPPRFAQGRRWRE